MIGEVLSEPEPLGDYPVYLANAMTNIPAFNFPWFFEADDWLVANTHVSHVFNPARKDLETIPLEEMKLIPGYDTGDLPTYIANSSFTMANAMEWDLPAIRASKGIVLGDGWPISTGARYERLVAEALGREVWLLHGTSPADFKLELDSEPEQLTAYLRGFGKTASIPELIAELRGRLSHVPGFAAQLDRITAVVA